MKSQQIGIVGGGIFGLAHAWAASKRNHQVHLFDRSSSSQGASIRNFGMIWPIGQPFGPRHDAAMKGVQLWKDLASLSGLWLNPCGSLHLAHHDDELAVLEEYSLLSSQQDVKRVLVTPAEIQQLTPAANLAGLKGGLYSPTEMGVNPPAAIRAITDWIRSLPNLTFSGGTFIRNVESYDSGKVQVQTSLGQTYDFDHVFVCSGADVQTLFPAAYFSSGIRICKLQMMATIAQPSGWRLGPHLASGLTLRHYPSFLNCPSLSAVQQRIAEQSSQLDHWGIHVMASQNELGELILGDSHEYDDRIEPFDKQTIDDLILEELKKVFDFPNWELGRRWHGMYAKHPTDPCWIDNPQPGVTLLNGLGGNGMTLALGLAEEFWENRSTS